MFLFSLRGILQLSTQWKADKVSVKHGVTKEVRQDATQIQGIEKHYERVDAVVTYLFRLVS
jgi:hypothetical protein